MGTERARQSLPEGYRIDGRYELIRVIATGGNGAVYEAQTRDLRRVAVKVFFDRDSAPGLVRFFREIEVMRRIKSDHVIPLSHAGLDPSTGFRYLVMPLLIGEDLRTLVKRL